MTDRGAGDAIELRLEADGTARPCLLYDLDWLERRGTTPPDADEIEAARRRGDVLVVTDEVHVPVQLLVRRLDRAVDGAAAALDEVFGSVHGVPRAGTIGRSAAGGRLRLPSGRVRFDPADALPRPDRHPEPHGTVPPDEHLVDVMQVRWRSDPEAERAVALEVVEPGDAARARAAHRGFVLLVAATMLVAGGLVAAQVLAPTTGGPGVPVFAWPIAGLATAAAWLWMQRRLRDPAVERHRRVRRHVAAAWPPLVVVLAAAPDDVRELLDGRRGDGERGGAIDGFEGLRFEVGLRAVAAEVAARARRPGG